MMWEHFWIAVRLYHVAALRADEGIVPYDRRKYLRDVGVDPLIDPKRHGNRNVDIEAKRPSPP